MKTHLRGAAAAIEKLEVKPDDFVLFRYNKKNTPLVRLKRLFDDAQALSKQFKVRTLVLPDDVQVSTLPKEELERILNEKVSD